MPDRFPRDRSAYRDLFASHFPWAAWEAVIEANGWTIERPSHEPHPDDPTIIYPLDYGSVDGTLSTDGEAVDCFVGSASPDAAAGGLVGAILTTDHRKGDREVKLLYRCTPPEIYTAHGFINYDRTLLEGLLVLRTPMHELWEGRGA
jgi:inorganic pyrophosphatase